MMSSRRRGKALRDDIIFDPQLLEVVPDTNCLSAAMENPDKGPSENYVDKTR